MLEHQGVLIKRIFLHLVRGYCVIVLNRFTLYIKHNYFRQNKPFYVDYMSTVDICIKLTIDKTGKS